MTNDDWEAKKQAARERLAQTFAPMAPGIIQGVQSAVHSLRANPAFLEAAALHATIEDMNEEARLDKVRRDAEQAAREELDRAAEFKQAKAEALARLGEAPAPPPVAPDAIPLPEKQRRVLEILKAIPRGEGMTGKQIINALADGTEQSTLTKHLIPALKKAGHPIQNRRGGAGYYLAQ